MITRANNIIEKINQLEVATKEDIELDIAECYPLYADVFVYNAIEDDKYYVEHIENNYIDTVTKEELIDIIRDNIEQKLKMSAKSLLDKITIEELTTDEAYEYLMAEIEKCLDEPYDELEILDDDMECSCICLKFPDTFIYKAYGGNYLYQCMEENLLLTWTTEDLKKWIELHT